MDVCRRSDREGRVEGRVRVMQMNAGSFASHVQTLEMRPCLRVPPPSRTTHSNVIVHFELLVWFGCEAHKSARSPVVKPRQRRDTAGAEVTESWNGHVCEGRHQRSAGARKLARSTSRRPVGSPADSRRSTLRSASFSSLLHSSSLMLYC
jgi:hypothetical protein